MGHGAGVRAFSRSASPYEGSPRALITGGSGFLGSHLAQALIARGWEVVVYDNLSTGQLSNLDGLDPDRLTVVIGDVSEGIPVDGPLDAVLHFASPASPPDYLSQPLETLRAGALGSEHALELAREHGARFLLASTSEVYGEPLVHPQPEDYCGNVSTTGPRAVYDEAKRYAETLAMTYHRVHGVDVKIARIFNVYGPRLRPTDGRVVSNFLRQAMTGEPITIYGDGTQTRSLCYVDDVVEGLLSLLDSGWIGPLNIGNADECMVLELAKLVVDIVGSRSPIEYRPLPVDDPTRRCPDTRLARQVLGWEPQVGLIEGVQRTMKWFEGSLAAMGFTLTDEPASNVEMLDQFARHGGGSSH
jgi:dTDP-glucose 4,6-dehydratase